MTDKFSFTNWRIALAVMGTATVGVTIIAVFVAMQGCDLKIGVSGLVVECDHQHGDVEP